MSYIMEFIKTAFPNPYVALFYISILLISLWMYKETRNGYVENAKLNQQRTDKALDCYSDLELELYKYVNDQSEFLHVAEKMSKASSLMPSELLKESMRCRKENDIKKRKQLIQEFHTKLHDEMFRLKQNQSDPVSFKSEDGATYIENILKTKLAPFAYPLMQTFLILLAMLFIVHFISILSESSQMEQLVYLSLLAAFLLYVGFMIAIVSIVIVKKRFNHSWLNWSLFALFALSPIGLIEGPWYRGIIAIVVFVAYVLFAAKKSTKRAAT